MGHIGRLSRALRADKAKLRNVRLSREIEIWYATHPLSPWQKQKVTEVREAYAVQQKNVDMAHNIASSELSDMYMEFELEYLKKSHEFREANPGKIYHEPGLAGLGSRMKSMLNNFKLHASAQN